MYVDGVGNIPELGLGENGPETDFVRYKKVDEVVDGYIKSIRKPLFKQLWEGLDSSKSTDQSEAPRDLYDVNARARSIIERNGPVLAQQLLVEEYFASAFEGPAHLSKLPGIVK